MAMGEISDKRKSFGSIYLASYNAVQTIGWSYLFYLVLAHFLTGHTLDTLWTRVAPTLLIFQNFAILEIVHSVLGITKSNIFVTLIQVSSRVVVCFAFIFCPSSQTSYGLPTALFAWSVTEIVRYSYYAFNIMGGVPFPLLWCRYSFFYVLYPVGVTGELLCYYDALETAPNVSITLPNSLNFTFNYPYFIWLTILIYLYFPSMFGHMLRQRKKTLYPQVADKTS